MRTSIHTSRWSDVGKPPIGDSAGVNTPVRRDSGSLGTGQNTPAPARPTPRQRVMELSWSLVLAVVFAGLGTLLSAALKSDGLATLFFVSVAASWAVLVPAKFWDDGEKEPWTRRVVMLILGGLVGLLACWVDGLR